MSEPMYRPTDLREIQALHEQDRAPAQEAASAAEHEAKGELVQGELAGKPIWVKPVKQWRASALHALREGDLQGWAEATLSDDDWATWEEVDPTLEEIEKFFASINSKLGTNPGNSRASRRGSRSTQRR